MDISPLLGLNLMQMGARHPATQNTGLSPGLLAAMMGGMPDVFGKHRGGAGPAKGSFRAAQEAGITPDFQARQLVGK